VNDSVLRAILDEAMVRAGEVVPVPKIMPGTVVDATDPSEVSVLVDGDVDPVPGQSLIGPIYVGARVMVTFNPPSGMLITGEIPNEFMTWNDVTVFTNGWGNFSPATDTVARYRQEQNGVIRMQGLISAGVLNTAAFTLPEALWPTRRFIFSPNSGGVGGRLDVNLDGTIVPVAASNAFFGLNCEWTIGD
jgi:hypothetical protein